MDALLWFAQHIAGPLLLWLIANLPGWAWWGLLGLLGLSMIRRAPVLGLAGLLIGFRAVGAASRGSHGNPLRGLIVVVVACAAIGHALGMGDGGPAAPVPAQATTVSVPVAGDLTPITWAQTLLSAIGAPVSSENLRAITTWERAEGGHWQNAARFNPLNTTQRMPGSVSMNSVGVQAYTSWSQGLQATVTTLRNGHYGGILAALANGSCAPCVAAAVGASPWGTGRFPV